MKTKAVSALTCTKGSRREIKENNENNKEKEVQ